MNYPKTLFTCRNRYKDEVISKYFPIGGTRCDSLGTNGKCFYDKRKCKIIVYKKV